MTPTDAYAAGIVVLTVVIVLWLSAQKNKAIKRVLDWLPAILFAYIIPATITHSFGLDYASVALHQWSRSAIIPLAIVMVMSALPFGQLRMIGFRPIALFVIGSLVIASAAPLLLYIFILSDSSYHELVIAGEYWKGLVPIVGGWIGGSTSQLVLKEVVDCPEGIFLAVLVLDNILVNIWTILMFQLIKRSDDLNKALGIKDHIPDFVPDHLDQSALYSKASLKTLFIAVGLVVITPFLGLSFLWNVVVLSVAGLLLGNFVKRWNHTLVLKVGGILIVVIMAILGLKLDFGSFSLPGSIVMFVIIWLILHFLFMSVAAYFLRLHMAWVPIASMANLGGISTAPAVTAAYNEEWMPFAIILAILSMVTGTAWGLFTIFLFQQMYL